VQGLGNEVREALESAESCDVSLVEKAVCLGMQGLGNEVQEALESAVFRCYLLAVVGELDKAVALVCRHL
jgi:hypothetical protein